MNKRWFEQAQLPMRGYCGDPITTAMLVATVASTATGAYSAYQQGQAAEFQSEQQGRQAAVNMREQELKRLKQFKETSSQNIARMAAGGLSMTEGGTIQAIQQGTAEALQSDVKAIQTAGAAQQSLYKQAGDMAKAQANVQMLNSVVQGVTQGAGIAYGVNQTDTPKATKTPTKAPITNPAQAANQNNWFKPVNPNQTFL